MAGMLLRKPRAGSVVLGFDDFSTALGTRWNHLRVGGSASNIPTIDTARFRAGRAVSTATQHFSVFNQAQAPTDDFRVSAIVRQAPNATYGGLIIRAELAGTPGASASINQTGVVVHLHTTSSARGFTTVINSGGGGGYTRRQDLGANVALNDFIELEAQGNEYRFYRTPSGGSRILMATWVDTGNVFPPNANRRYGGIYSSNTSTTVTSPILDDFKVETLAA